MRTATYAGNSLRRCFLALAAMMLLGLGIVAMAPPTAAHAADPVYTICLAEKSEGYYTTSAGANWIRRYDSLGIYPDLKIWEGQCKSATISSTSSIQFNGYFSWRVSTKLSTQSISDYGSCHTGPSHPTSSVKYIGYRNSTCTFTTPGAGGSGIVPATYALPDNITLFNSGASVSAMHVYYGPSIIKVYPGGNKAFDRTQIYAINFPSCNYWQVRTRGGDYGSRHKCYYEESHPGDQLELIYRTT